MNRVSDIRKSRGTVNFNEVGNFVNLGGTAIFRPLITQGIFLYLKLKS